MHKDIYFVLHDNLLSSLCLKILMSSFCPEKFKTKQQQKKPAKSLPTLVM